MLLFALGLPANGQKISWDGQSFPVSSSLEPGDEPQVVLLSNQKLAIVWISQGSPDDHSVRARLFNLSGAALTSDVIVKRQLENEGYPVGLSVAVSKAGVILVTWGRFGGYVSARCLDSQLNPLTKVFPVNVDRPEAAPTALAVNDGFYIVTSSNPTDAVYRLDGSCKLGPRMELAWEFDDKPRFAYLPLGGFLAAWERFDGTVEKVILGRLDERLKLVGPPRVIASGFPEDWDARPIVDESGTAVLLLNRRRDRDDFSLYNVYAQAVSFAGTPITPLERLGPDTPPRFSPRAVSVAPGIYLLAWSSAFSGGAVLTDALLSPLTAELAAEMPIHQVLHVGENRVLFRFRGGCCLQFSKLLARFAATDLPLSTAPCVETSENLCLQGGRFEVAARWRLQDGAGGPGHAVPLTSDTGYFWFFSPANVELVTKVLDACALTMPRYWVFGAGLTNVEVLLSVRDSVTGAARTYVNPAGIAFPPLQDTNAFETCAQ